MRLILIYDLPVLEESDRKIYNHFHKDIKKIGFNMLQYSIYTKVIVNDSVMKQILFKIQKIVPNKGNIIAFKITEKQYQDMICLSGEKNKMDTIVGNNELVVFGGDEKST